MPFGWQDRPEGWKDGDPIPGDWDAPIMDAETLEAFGEWIISQIGPLFEDPDTGYPERGDSSFPRPWVGWSDPGEEKRRGDYWIQITPPS